jgi:hypothetical protein
MLKVKIKLIKIKAKLWSKKLILSLLDIYAYVGEVMLIGYMTDFV